MFKATFPRRPSRFTVPILGALLLAGSFTASPAAAEPPQHQRATSHRADVLLQVNSHREYRRDGGRDHGAQRQYWRPQRHHHEQAQRPHHRRHIVKRHWRHHRHGYRAWNYNWRRHHNRSRRHWGHERSRRDWGHQARRHHFR